MDVETKAGEPFVDGFRKRYVHRRVRRDHVVPEIAVSLVAHVQVRITLAGHIAVSIGNDGMFGRALERKERRHLRIEACVKRIVEIGQPCVVVGQSVNRVDVVPNPRSGLVAEPGLELGDEHVALSARSPSIVVHPDRDADVVRQLADGLPLGERGRGREWVGVYRLPPDVLQEHVAPVERPGDGI